jgi:hypothetical protein
MKKSIVFALVLASVSVFVAAPAFADETAKPAKAAAAPSDKSEKGYGYTFTDDPLQSGVDGTKGFIINVPPKPARQQLLRPRLSFVTEMLKSVEAL